MLFVQQTNSTCDERKYGIKQGNKFDNIFLKICLTSFQKVINVKLPEGTAINIGKLTLK